MEDARTDLQAETGLFVVALSVLARDRRAQPFDEVLIAVGLVERDELHLPRVDQPPVLGLNGGAIVQINTWRTQLHRLTRGGEGLTGAGRAIEDEIGRAEDRH